MNSEKVPYPPPYAEVYPTVPLVDANNMGWQQPPPDLTTPINQPTEVHNLPPAYGTQQAATTAILQNQSRVGLYPVKLSPCPNCLRETKTTITYDTTLKTHLFALALCLACCWCCTPLPYVTNNATKTASHFCENCKSYIGTYDRNPCKW